MKKILFFVVLFISFTANAVVIDFDTLPGGGVIANNTSITNQYASLGVAFSVIENGSIVPGGPLAITSFAPTGQDGNRLGNFFGGTTSNRADILRIDFSSLVSNVSFDFMPQGNSGAQVRVLALDNSLNTISDELTGISGFPIIANYSVTGTGISRLDIFQPVDSWNWGLDNLSFQSSVSPVPAPAAVWLIGLGLIMVLGMSKKASRLSEKHA